MLEKYIFKILEFSITECKLRTMTQIPQLKYI